MFIYARPYGKTAARSGLARRLYGKTAARFGPAALAYTAKPPRTGAGPCSARRQKGRGKRCCARRPARLAAEGAAPPPFRTLFY